MRALLRRLPLVSTWSQLSPRARREALAGYLFIAPWLLGFILFFVGPIAVSFLASFTRWNIVSAPEWVGLANYRTIFTSDPTFVKSVRVTLTYALIFLPLDMILGITVAVAMNQKVRGIGVFRTLFYLPYVVPQIAAALVWTWMLSTRYGLVNSLLRGAGIDGPNWLGSPRYVLISIVIMSLWGVGGSAVIYLAGLQNIPQVMYEAATIDGASAWQRFRRITLPLLTPTIFFQLVLGLIGVFQTFTPAFVAAGRTGGPLQSGLFYMLYVFNRSFDALRLGYGSALSWIMTVFILLVTLLIFRSSRYWVYYEAERRRG